MTTRSGHPYTVEQEATSGPSLTDLMTVIQQMKEQMNQRFTDLEHRLTDVEHRQQNPLPVPEQRPSPERRRYHRETSEEEYDREDIPRRGRQGRRPHHHDDDIVRHARMDAPIFDGSLNPQFCKDWIHDMEHYFLWYDFPETRKVMFAKGKLAGNAKQFWLAEESRRELNGRPPVDQWEVMKRIFVNKYVPETFNDQLKIQFALLKQGSMTVQEYTTKFDEFVVKCAVVEDDQMTIARFRAGLRPDIRHEIDLVPFSTLHHSYQKALQFETYLKPVQKRATFQSDRASTQSFQTGSLSSGYVRPSRDVVSGTVTQPSSVTSSGASGWVSEPRSGTVSSSAGSRQASSTTKCFKCKGLGHFAADCASRNLFMGIPVEEFEGQDLFLPQPDVTGKICVHEPAEPNSDDECGIT